MVPLSSYPISYERIPYPERLGKLAQGKISSTSVVAVDEDGKNLVLFRSVTDSLQKLFES